MEHRLVGAFLVPAFSTRVGSVGVLVRWNGAGVGVGCLARCWVLRDRATRIRFGLVLAPLLGGRGLVRAGGCAGWFFWSWALPIMRVFLVWGVGCRLYVENFTVDASIFVAKFLRAHGGCLGTRNRRRT